MAIVWLHVGTEHLVPLVWTQPRGKLALFIRHLLLLHHHHHHHHHWCTTPGASIATLLGTGGFKIGHRVHKAHQAVVYPSKDIGGQGGHLVTFHSLTSSTTPDDWSDVRFVKTRTLWYIWNRLKYNRFVNLWQWGLKKRFDFYGMTRTLTVLGRGWAPKNVFLGLFSKLVTAPPLPPPRHAELFGIFYVQFYIFFFNTYQMMLIIII